VSLLWTSPWPRSRVDVRSAGELPLSARSLLWGLLTCLGTSCGSGTPAPNVLLVTLDTTRVDRLGCYGHERPTSPGLDRLAAESVLYTRAYATTSWTLPAHASIFTGKLPTSHGAQYDPAGELALTDAITGELGWQRLRARGVAADEQTMAMLLADAGYATAGVVAGPWLKDVFGLDRGFEHYDDAGIAHLNGRPARDVSDAALAWLERRPDGEPWFLFLNYFDAHGPYEPPPGFKDRFLPQGVASADLPPLELLSLRYDEEIAAMDEQLERVLDALRASGEWENTLIIVTADHGELLGEDGLLGHGNSLSQAEIHIPLLVKLPGPAAPRRDDTLVQQTDLLPLVLQQAGVDTPAHVQGRLPEDRSQPVVAEVYPLPAMDDPTRDWRQRGHWRVLLQGELKYCWGSLGRHRLMDLAQDPFERENLRDAQPDRATQMEQALLGYLQSLPEPGAASPPRELDEQTRRALESLGYTGR
jgi:hypothetical protein